MKTLISKAALITALFSYPLTVLASELSSWLSAFDRFSGPGISYIVVKDGEVIEKEGFGLANIESRILMDADTPTRTGSVGKTFTALAVAIAKEQGLLTFEDSVRTYLPQLPQYMAKIQVQHLLYHTSGLPGWDKGYTQSLCPLGTQDKVTNRDVINWLSEKPESYFLEDGQQALEPGERFKYSNTAYVLLASIVESASGMNYADFLRKNVFNKADMKAFLSSETRQPTVRASGYSDFPFFENMDGYRMGCDSVNGDGGIFLSIEDYGKYMRGLEKDVFVGAETKEKMWTKGRLNDGSEGKVGFAWWIDEFQGMKVINHEGGWGGYASYIAYFPQSRLWIGFSTNCIGVRRMFEDDIESLLRHLVPYL